jgi:hypothetical protein
LKAFLLPARLRRGVANNWSFCRQPASYPPAIGHNTGQEKKMLSYACGSGILQEAQLIKEFLGADPVLLRALITFGSLTFTKVSR